MSTLNGLELNYGQCQFSIHNGSGKLDGLFNMDDELSTGLLLSMETILARYSGPVTGLKGIYNLNVNLSGCSNGNISFSKSCSLEDLFNSKVSD